MSVTISASEVNKLRGVTGAGMMDCKKALVEAGGDFDKAIELLRLKGQKVSASRQDREAKEGVVFATVVNGGKTGMLLELNSETDFVAKNEDFVKMGEGFLAAAVAGNPATLEALLELPVDGRPIKEHISDAVGRIGEKIEISKFNRTEGESVVSYIHPGAKVGVLVAFAGASGVDLERVGKDVCMQIAAMRPVSVDASGVDPDLLEKELELGREQARQEGKPENMVDKIAQGKLNKFFKESTLLAQDFVKDPSKSIEQYLKEQSPNLKVLSFARAHVGFN